MDRIAKYREEHAGETNRFMQTMCVKSQGGVWLECCDKVAELAGLDSKESIVGKRDSELMFARTSGKKRADTDRACLLFGKIKSVHWVPTIYGWRRFLLDQRLLEDGNFLYINTDTTSDCNYLHWVERIDDDNRCIHMGPEFNDIALSPEELMQFRMQKMENTKDEIHRRTGFSHRRIEKNVTKFNRMWRVVESAYAERLAQGNEFKKTGSYLVDSGFLDFIFEQDDWFNFSEVGDGDNH